MRATGEAELRSLPGDMHAESDTTPQEQQAPHTRINVTLGGPGD